MYEGRPETIQSTIPNPTPLQVRNAKRQIVQRWTDLYGMEPFDLRASQQFDAWEGCDVVTITCRPAIPPGMKWAKA